MSANVENTEALHNQPVLPDSKMVAIERVVDSSLFGLLVGDRTGQITYMNGALQTMLGYSLDFPLPAHLRWNQLTPPEYTMLDNQAVAELLANGYWGPAEKEFLAADGSRVPVLMSATVIGQDSDGGLQVACCVVDMRPLRAARTEGAARVQRSALFVESIPEILYTNLPDGTLDYVSAYFYEYTGLSSVEELGAAWLGVIHPNEFAHTSAQWQRALEAGESLLVEFRLRRFDGAYRWFRMRGVPQRDPTGVINKWMGICVDIDDEWRTTQERVQLLEREQAARTAAEAAVLRLGYLQRTTAALARVQTLEHVATVIAEQSMNAFGASAAAIRLLNAEGTHLEEIGVIGHDRSLAAEWTRIPIEAQLTVTDAVRTGRTIVVRNTSEVDEHYPTLAKVVAQHGYESFVAAPLLQNNRAIGVLGLAFRVPLRLLQEDVSLLEAIAQQCVQAIERAQLHAAEQAARAEAAELLAQLDVVINEAPIGMGFVDTDFRYVRVNEALAAMNRMPIEAHIGRTARELFPHYGPTWESYWQKVLDTGEAITDLELRIVSEYRIVYAQVSYYPVRLIGTTTVRGIGIVVSDVTERRQSELSQTLLARASAILGDSQNVERSLQEVARLIVPELADYCAINLVENEQARTVALLHFDPNEQPLLDKLYSNTEAYSPAMLLGRVVQLRATLVTADGAGLIDQLPYAEWQRDLIHQLGAQSWMVVPLLAHDHVLGAITMTWSRSGRRYNQHDVALVEELARRCALAIENTRLYRDAQDAIQLRDAFLSVAAHELRTPLTSLYGNAQLLQRRFARAADRPERDVHSLAIIVSQAERLNRMIGALLDVSRLQQGQLAIANAAVDLCALITRLVAETEPTLASHTLHVELPPAPLVIRGDELRLEQVLANLVQNGIKYTPGGGTVVVRAEQRGRQALITVRDSGIGIPADALPQLFQRFYRAHNAAAQHIGGLGIGLFVAREIVHMHGGTISIESIEDQGTTVLLRLPLAE